MAQGDNRRLHEVGRTWPSPVAVAVRRALAAPSRLAQLGWTIAAVEGLAATVRVLVDADAVGFDGDLFPAAREALAGDIGRDLAELLLAVRSTRPGPGDERTADASALLSEVSRITAALPEFAERAVTVVEAGPTGTLRLRLLRGLGLPAIHVPDSPELPIGAAVVLAPRRDDALVLRDAGAMLAEPLARPFGALKARAIGIPAMAWQLVSDRLWLELGGRRLTAVLLGHGADRYLDPGGNEWIRLGDLSEEGSEAAVAGGEPWRAVGPATMQLLDRFYPGVGHDPRSAAQAALELLGALPPERTSFDALHHAALEADSLGMSDADPCGTAVRVPELPPGEVSGAAVVGRAFLAWTATDDATGRHPAFRACAAAAHGKGSAAEVHDALLALTTVPSPTSHVADATIWERVLGHREQGAPWARRVASSSWPAAGAIERQRIWLTFGGTPPPVETDLVPAVDAALSSVARMPAPAPVATERLARYLAWRVEHDASAAKELAALYLGPLASPLRALAVADAFPTEIPAALAAEIARAAGRAPPPHAGAPVDWALAHVAAGRHDEAASVLETAASMAEGAAAAVPLLALARLRLDVLADAEGAKAIALALLDLDADDTDVLSLAERVHDALGDRAAHDEARRRRAARAVGAARRRIALPLPDVEPEAHTEFVTSPVATGRALLDAGRIEEAKDHFEALARALERLDASDAALELEVWQALADTRERLGDDVGAAGAYERLLSLDPASPGPREGLARIAVRDGDLATADSHCGALIRLAQAAGDDAALARHLQTRATIRVRPPAAPPAGAIGAGASRADAAAPSPTPEADAAVLPPNDDAPQIEHDDARARDAEARGELAAAEAIWRERLATASDALERFNALLELTELLRRHKGPSPAVVELLVEAHLLRPESKAVVVRLIEVERLLGNKPRAARWLEALAGLESTPQRRARVLAALAQLTRELGRDHDARLFAERALELHADVEAFGVLRDCLEASGDAEAELSLIDAWVESLRSTERGAKLLERRYALLARLGDVRETREALIAAVRADPQNATLLEALARAEEATDTAGDAAMTLYRRVLALAPRQVSAYRGLGRIVARRRDRDAAWCVASAVVQLGAAGLAERDFVEKHRRGLLAVKRPLDGIAAWETHLIAETQDLPLTRLFELVGRTLGTVAFPWTLAEAGLNPADRVSMRDGGRFVDLLRTVSKILDVPLPTVYRKALVPTLCKLPMSPPVLLVNPDLEVLHKGKALRFLLGKALTFFLPGHLLAGGASAGVVPNAPPSLISSARLRTLVIAASSAGFDEPATIAEPGVLEAREALVTRLRRQDHALLRELVQTIEAREAGPNVSEWLAAVELTANRAGLLLSNDLDVAVRMLELEHESGTSWSRLPLAAAVDDLLRYTTSDRYFALRRALGAAIEELPP